jgi:hypothetical protein
MATFNERFIKVEKQEFGAYLKIIYESSDSKGKPCFGND